MESPELDRYPTLAEWWVAAMIGAAFIGLVFLLESCATATASGPCPCGEVEVSCPCVDKVGYAGGGE